MSLVVQDLTGQPIFTPDTLEAIAARDRRKGVLPCWMDHRPWPLGFVAAIEVARERNDRDAVRALYKQARAVLKADKRRQIERSAMLIQRLRDAYDLDFTVTLLDADDPVARSINDGTFDREAHTRSIEARFGEPVLFTFTPGDGWPDA